MHVDHHPLVAEFPEFKTAIHELKQSDAHFARLFEEYEVIDKAVVRVENGVEAMADLALEALKKQQAKGELPKLAKQALQKP